MTSEMSEEEAGSTPSIEYANAWMVSYNMYGLSEKRRAYIRPIAFNKIEEEYREFIPGGEQGTFFEVRFEPFPGGPINITDAYLYDGIFSEAGNDVSMRKPMPIFIYKDGEMDTDQFERPTIAKRRAGLFYHRNLLNNKVQDKLIEDALQREKALAQEIGLTPAIQAVQTLEKQIAELQQRLTQAQQVQNDRLDRYQTAKIEQATATMGTGTKTPPATPYQGAETMDIAQFDGESERKKGDEESYTLPAVDVPRQLRNVSSTGNELPSNASGAPVTTTIEEPTAATAATATTTEESKEQEKKKPAAEPSRRSTRGKNPDEGKKDKQGGRKTRKSKGGKKRKGTHRKSH